MNSFFDALAEGSAIHGIGWTLLHFVWQAAAIAIIVYTALTAISIPSANIRYWIVCAGLSAMVACPAFTMSYLCSSSNSDRPAVSNPNSLAQTDTRWFASNRNSNSDDSVDIAAGTIQFETRPAKTNKQESRLFATGNRFFQSLLPMIVGIWLGGVTLHLLRLFGGLLRVRHWVSSAKPLSDARLNQVFATLCNRINLRGKIRLLASDKTSVPAAAGILRPTVLIPASLLTGLSAREIELVLAHELAHIKRHDFLVNLLQKTAESLLFYHPAVWWISNQISIERENCCDDLAVSVCGDRIALAKALTALESARCSEQEFVPAATGGLLKQRIRRLLFQEPQQIQSVWPAGLISILLAGIVLTIMPSFSSMVAANPVLVNPPPATTITVPIIPIANDVETKPELRKKDSKTGIEQRVFTNIRLTTTRDNESKQAVVDLKYSNVIPYTFIPSRIAESLNAVKIGEIDFSNYKDTKRPTGVNWNFIPNDFANPTGFIKDGIRHYFVDFVTEPTDNPIVPYFDDPLFTPDHLGFYGMNPTKQMKFDVIRIGEVDLGIGKTFGPVNALVLNNDNSEFGLLGNKWARKVRGKKGGTLVHSAVGEFLIYPPKKKDEKKQSDPKQSDPKQSDPKQSDPKQVANGDRVEFTDQNNLPDFEVVRREGSIKHLAVKSINVRRSPAELLKHFRHVIERHGSPRKGTSITNMESIVSAIPAKRFANKMESSEVIFSLPEGSKSHAAIIGEKVEMIGHGDSIRIIVTNGKVQWLDSVGVVRAEASPGGAAEQLVVSAKIKNDEVELKMRTQRIKPVVAYPEPPVQVTMNVESGAPADEDQPPHGSIRYEIMEADAGEDKPMRMKMKWRYDLDRLAKEAEKQTGQKWEAIIWDTDDFGFRKPLDSRKDLIWGVDDPKSNLRR